MIHYHGTPIGGAMQEIARFLRGRHALVPHKYQQDMGAVADLCADFVLDNSAFSEWKQGTPIDVPGYTKWAEQWRSHPGFSWALIPDVIDGTADDNDALVRDWPRHIRGVPVWHMHEDLGRLARLAREWPVVALGSSGEWPTPGRAGWWTRMAAAMDVACDENGRPLCRLHGLRMLDPRIFTKLPLASADSTNVGRNCNQLARYGMYVPPTTAQRAITLAERIEHQNSAPIWVRQHPTLKEMLG